MNPPRPTNPARPGLTETLRESQRLGMLGDRSIPEVIEHARWFVTALDGASGPVVDLGAGGGVPGLVVARDRPDLSVLLIDRRQKRADFLARAVLRLGYEDRVTVRHADVADLVRHEAGTFGAVTARGFGPPAATLRWAAELIDEGGRIVISEPPSGDRWDPAVVAELGLERRRVGPVSVFDRRR